MIPIGSAEAVTIQTDARQAIFWPVMVTYPTRSQNTPHQEALTAEIRL